MNIIGAPTTNIFRNWLFPCLCLLTCLVLSLQVDFVIKEATNMDNLAQLYEGWTAWV